VESLGFRTFRQVCDELNWKIFTPTSMVRPYTGCMGESMNIWYDRSLDWQQLGFEDPHVDVEGMADSAKDVLIGVRGVMAGFDHVFLGGFSMGGGLVLNMLHHPLPDKVRGVFCMGSFVVGAAPVLNEDLNPNAQKLPVLMMHGTVDSMVRVDWAEKTATSLLLKGMEVQFRKYENVDHEVAGDELHDLTFWLKDIVLGYTQKEEEERMNAVKSEKEKVEAGAAATANVATATTTAKGPPAAQSSVKAPVDREEMEMEEPVECTASRPGVHESPIKYRLMKVSSGADRYIVDYEVPPRLVGVVAARDVLCCGAAFEMSASPDGDGVRTQIISSTPHQTCREIGIRLLKRLDDDPNNPVNPCPMS
jgi:phospholipase/carboxylesterase